MKRISLENSEIRHKAVFEEANRERWEKYWETMGGTMRLCMKALDGADWLESNGGCELGDPSCFCADLHKFVIGKWPGESEDH